MIYLKDSKIPIKNARQIANVFHRVLLLEDEVDRAKEHFFVMHLDTRSRINMVELVSLGTLTSSVVHPRETFRRAIMHNSAAIVVAHNHPSGKAEASAEDMQVTKLLFDAGKVLGIDLLDHIIFSDKEFFSFKENRMEKMRGGETDKR
jgi:DNA repair protein RadC